MHIKGTTDLGNCGTCVFGIGAAVGVLTVVAGILNGYFSGNWNPALPCTYVGGALIFGSLATCTAMQARGWYLEDKEKEHVKNVSVSVQEYFEGKL